MSLITGLDTTSRGSLVTCQNQVYFANGFNNCKVWDGIATSMQDSGITGPVAVIGSPSSTAASGFDAGTTRLIRYRYQNSRTGYVSNPSPALSYTVSGSNGTLTFNISTSGTPIIRSTDAKADTIIVEATAVNGNNFWQTGTVANSASSITVGQPDITLTVQYNSDLYGSVAGGDIFSHEPPPLGTILVPYKGRLWVFGSVAYPLTGVTFTNNSAAVSGTGFSTRWVGFIIQRTGDSVAYQIAAVASSVAMTLTVVYAGTSGTSAATVATKTPNRGYYSRLFYPEEFYAAGFARDFLVDRGDRVSAAIGRKDGLYVMGLSSGERLIFNDDPSAGAGAIISKIQGRRGAFHNRALVDMDGKLYAWDRQGIYEVQEIPVPMSFPVDPILASDVDFTQTASFHACYDPIYRVLFFFYVQQGTTSCKKALCFDTVTSQWYFATFFQGIAASAIVPTSDGQVRMLLTDVNGYSWFYGLDGTFDGVPPNSPSVVTVSSASPTIINVNETLPASALLGVTVYNPLTAESAVVSANATNQITVGAGFSTAPGVAASLYLGPIQFEYRSNWWPGRDLNTIEDPVYLIIDVVPGTISGRVRIYLYTDYSTIPTTVTANAADTWPVGIDPPISGTNYISGILNGGNAQGIISIPIFATFNNVIQARITSILPDGPIRILNVRFALTPKTSLQNVGT